VRDCGFLIGYHKVNVVRTLENTSVLLTCWRESDSCLLFQKWSKSVRDKWPKGRVALMTKNKTRFGTLGRNPLGDFAHFSCVSVHRAPSLIF